MFNSIRMFAFLFVTLSAASPVYLATWDGGDPDNLATTAGIASPSKKIERIYAASDISIKGMSLADTSTWRRHIIQLLCFAALWAAGCGNSNSSTEVAPTYQEAAAVAQNTLPQLKDEIAGGIFKNAGFSSAQQAASSYFGEGYMIYYLDPVKFRFGLSWAPIKSMLSQSNPRWQYPQYIWEFPVYAGDSAITTFVLGYYKKSKSNQPWWHGIYIDYYTPTVKTKGTDFVSGLRAKAAVLSGDSSSEVHFIPLPQLATEMGLVTTPSGEFLALSSAPEAFGLQPKDFYTRQELLPAIRGQLAKIAAADELQPGADRTHSSGNCTYQNAEAAALKYRHEHLEFFRTILGYDYQQIFGDAPVDSIAVGKGYRMIDFDYRAYAPTRNMKSLLYAEDCEWIFGLHIDGDLKSGYLIRYDQYTFKPDTAWGGTLPRELEQVEAAIPGLLAEYGGTTYSLYRIKALPPIAQFTLIVTDKGEYISFGPPPLDGFFASLIPNPQDQRMFYRADEVIQALKDWHDYVMAPQPAAQ